MVWFVVGYLAFAIVCNFFCSLIVGIKLVNKCDSVEGLYDRVFHKHFLKSDYWIESELMLPVWLKPIFKTIFFPFNMTSLIKCYRDAVKDADEILKGDN